MYKKPKKKIAREREVKRERYSDLPRKCEKKKKKKKLKDMIFEGFFFFFGAICQFQDS
jgi:hypothetical protein